MRLPNTERRFLFDARGEILAFNRNFGRMPRSRRICQEMPELCRAEPCLPALSVLPVVTELVRDLCARIGYSLADFAGFYPAGKTRGFLSKLYMWEEGPRPGPS